MRNRPGQTVTDRQLENWSAALQMAQGGNRWNRWNRGLAWAAGGRERWNGKAYPTRTVIQFQGTSDSLLLLRSPSPLEMVGYLVCFSSASRATDPTLAVKGYIYIL